MTQIDPGGNSGRFTASRTLNYRFKFFVAFNKPSSDTAAMEPRLEN